MKQNDVFPGFYNRNIRLIILAVLKLYNLYQVKYSDSFVEFCPEMQINHTDSILVI